jgi:hypothetical protein
MLKETSDAPGEDLSPVAEQDVLLQRQPESKVPQREELWLLGQPPLWRLLEFVKDEVLEGARTDRAALTAEWRAANEYYQELERREAGIATTGSHRELDPGLERLAAEVRAHAQYRESFSTLPTELGMVELDRLIVGQNHVTRTFVDQLMARTGPARDPEALFRICLPLSAAKPPVQICRANSQRYVFRCASGDLRYHQTTVLHPEQIRRYHSFGTIAGIIGVVVGYGYDFMSAVRVGKRVLLTNGYHRACALRALGVTHAPCVIQTATSGDELRTAVRARVAEQPEFYFESARPPLLKDFFDPKIRKVLPIRDQVHVVEVTVDVKHLTEDPILTV